MKVHIFLAVSTSLSCLPQLHYSFIPFAVYPTLSLFHVFLTKDYFFLPLGVLYLTISNYFCLEDSEAQTNITGPHSS